MKFFFLPTIVMFVSFAPIHSEETVKYTTLDQCSDLLAEKGQQPANFCASQVYDYFDKILNITYSKLVPLLNKNEKERLRLAQRAWISFRDNDCLFEGLKFEGGSLEPYEVESCKIIHTRRRIEDLKNAFQAYSEMN